MFCLKLLKSLVEVNDILSFVEVSQCDPEDGRLQTSTRKFVRIQIYSFVYGDHVFKHYLSILLLRNAGRHPKAGLNIIKISYKLTTIINVV